MQISSVSTAYGGGEAQRLLARLFEQQPPPPGQDLPGDAASATSGASTAPTPPVGSSSATRFAQATLASLLDAQQAPPTSADIAGKVISAADSDGDGSLSLAEIEKALGQDTTSSTDGLSAAFAKLDTNGDGKLSQDELASALDAQTSASGVHHHHHHHHAVQDAQASGGQLAATILGRADTNGDGALSADEIAQALGTSTSDSLKQTLAGFDKNADGKLDSSELAAAIDAFRTAHRQTQATT